MEVDIRLTELFGWVNFEFLTTLRCEQRNQTGPIPPFGGN
jgi:hypothetical protein